MKNQFHRKALFYIALIAIGMLLIAASLSTLHFQPGMPFPGAETSQTSNDPVNKSNQPVIEFRLLLQLPLAIIFFLLLIVFIISLVKKIRLKDILKLTVGLLVVSCLFLLLNKIELPTPSASSVDSQGLEIPGSLNYDLAPIGNPPKELVWFVMIFLMIGTAFLVIWLLFQALYQPQKDDLIINEASKALKAIESGCDLRNVIIKCYMQMISIVQEEQGIERLNSVTPREFEHILAIKGIPIPPIHQLTGLFEKVRYGSKPTNLSDEKTAIECLSAIQLSFRSGDRGFK